MLPYLGECAVKKWLKLIPGNFLLTAGEFAMELS